MKMLWSMALTALAGLSALAFQGDGRLGGRVVDLKDEPVEGVELIFKSLQVPSFTETVVTKGNGNFVVNRVPQGPGTIEAKKDGYVNRTYDFIATRGTVRLTLRMVSETTTYESLGPQPKMSGTLEDTSGAPIADAEIRVYTEDLPSFQFETTTNAQGSFEAPSLENAEITVHARKEGYRDQLYRFTQPKSDYQLRNYRMQTMEEYYAEAGKEAPEKKEKTPEDMAIEMYNKAVEPYQNGDYALAENLAKQANGLDPNQEAAIKMLIFSNYRQNDWEEVLAFSEQFLAKNPEDENILNYALEAARRTKNKKKEASFTKALKKMTPETAETVFQDAITALNANDDDTARKHLMRVLELDPDYAEVYYELGKIDIRGGDLDAAVLNLKLFLKHAPKDHQLREEVTDLVVALSE